MAATVAAVVLFVAACSDSQEATQIPEAKSPQPVAAAATQLPMAATPKPVSATATPSPTPRAFATLVPGTEPPPEQAGRILLVREGDLYLLEERSERRITNSGDYWAGVVTEDRTVVAIERIDNGGSRLVRLEVTVSGVSTTAEVGLSWQPDERSRRHRYLVPSPNGDQFIVRGGPRGYVVVDLARESQTELGGGCCASWSPDGSRIAYLAVPEDYEFDEERVPLYELWVADLPGASDLRRVSSGVLRFFGLYGRADEDVAWWRDGAELLVPSAEGARWVQRSAPGSGLNMQGNNGLVSVDPVVGISREMASPQDLHRRLSQEFPELEDEVAISSATTPKSQDRAAFLVMDYGRTYAIVLLNREGEVEQIMGREVIGGYMVGMGAPLWSRDGRRLAYFGWNGQSKTPFIEVLDVPSGGIDRVWQSGRYPKPGHWDISPDGRWVWVPVHDYSGVDGSVTRSLTFLASVDRPGHVETITGTLLDWCCTR